MFIDPEKCSGCGKCEKYCPVQAIKCIHIAEKEIYEINYNNCCECQTCLRAAKCPEEAIQQTKLEWPRSIRRAFSDIHCPPELIGIVNRGGIGVKTNDVTGRYGPDDVTIGVEFGRPFPGLYLKDVDRTARLLAKIPVVFQPESPVTSLMINPSKGNLWPELINERVLSLILNIDFPLTKLAITLKALQEAASQIQSVFSISLLSYINDDLSMPSIDLACKLGFKPKLSSKVNLGLGKPLMRNYLNNMERSI